MAKGRRIARVALWSLPVLVGILVWPGRIQIRPARLERANGDVLAIEFVLAKLCSDAGCNSPDAFFEPNAIRTVTGMAPDSVLTPEQLKKTIFIYSHALYLLLGVGRNALESTEVLPGSSLRLSSFFHRETVLKLPSGYIHFGTDPCGARYNIFPGPWPEADRPIPFRIYNQKGATPDALTVSGDCLSGGTHARGFPAPLDKVAYVWSNGENHRSDQATYSTPPGETPHATGACAHYDPENGGPESYGGGDDINNWDLESSWHVFY